MPSPGLTNPCVLLVEDHAVLQQAVALALGARGIEVVSPETLDPETVIALGRARHPDVALLDFYLDHCDALPMVGPLAALGITVVMLTGATEERVLGECIEAGASGVISKSEGLDALLDGLDRALRGEALIREGDRQGLVTRVREARARERERLAPFGRLTSRERHVLALLMEGMSAEDIARREYVSLATVRSQIRAILTKLDVHSQLAAVALARRAGWVAA